VGACAVEEDAVPDRPDLLLVQPGTTAGWRRADAELRVALERLGVSVASCGSDFRLARHLRRGVVATDLAEAGAMRHALTRALRHHRPRAILYSSPQAAMLQPRGRLEGAVAVRFDAPAALNRHGPGSSLLHALERRALGKARLLLPIALEPQQAVLDALTVPTPWVALPIPVEPWEVSAEAAEEKERGPLALAYAGNPDKKGLDLVAEAWSATAPTGWRLVVTGIEAEAGRRFLLERAIKEPRGLEWAGVVEPERYRALLGSATILIAGSRYEDYGLAQLEALAAGCLLVTVPSGGPFEALRPARQLDSRLVASELSAASLGRALEAALALGEPERRDYRLRALELLRPYGRETLEQRLRDRVLPVLLA
jgi:glycosyltransferase involved in cell wall biosynthesis